MFDKIRYRRQLKKVHEDLQTIFDHAQKKRVFHVDKFRDIEDFMTTRERRVYVELKKEEWALSKLLGRNPQWGSARMLFKDEEDEVIPAAVSVKEDHSTKISYEYVELVDMMVKTINGKWSSTRWDWEPVESFKKQGWGRPADFNDYLNRWHNAETDEESEAILAEYRSKYPNAIY